LHSKVLVLPPMAGSTSDDGGRKAFASNYLVVLLQMKMGLLNWRRTDRKLLIV